MFLVLRNVRRHNLFNISKYINIMIKVFFFFTLAEKTWHTPQRVTRPVKRWVLLWDTCFSYFSSPKNFAINGSVLLIKKAVSSR